MIFDSLEGRGYRVYRVVSRKNFARFSDSGNNDECYYRFDVRRIPLFLRTDAWILTHSWGLLPLGQIKMRLGLKIGGYWIDFWHGLGGDNIVGCKSRERYLETCDLACVTSEHYQTDYAKAVTDKSKVIITGYARTDSLVSGSYDLSEISKAAKIPVNRKNILYAPTWGYEELLFTNDKTPEDAFRTIDILCKEQNCNFIIRPHIDCLSVILQRLEKIANSHENIYYRPMKIYPDGNDLLHLTDVLITDWSSINFDFLLLNKPIVYLDISPPTHGSWQLEEERAGGYHCSTTKKLISVLAESLKQPNLFQTERDALIEKLYGNNAKYADGNATERCVRQILKLIGKNA